MRFATFLFAVVSAFSLAAVADEPDARSGIAWYGTWERGLRVAKSTGRPILLISAAPQCHGVSGLW